jgi:hypothetical protein
VATRLRCGESISQSAHVGLNRARRVKRKTATWRRYFCLPPGSGIGREMAAPTSATRPASAERDKNLKRGFRPGLMIARSDRRCRRPVRQTLLSAAKLIPGAAGMGYGRRRGARQPMLTPLRRQTRGCDASMRRARSVRAGRRTAAPSQQGRATSGSVSVGSAKRWVSVASIR